MISLQLESRQSLELSLGWLGKSCRWSNGKVAATPAARMTKLFREVKYPDFGYIFHSHARLA